MSEEYKAKIFKSGNSLALRLPKALGFKEGAEMTLREDHGRFTFEPAQNERKIDVSKFAGKAPCWSRCRARISMTVPAIGT